MESIGPPSRIAEQVSNNCTHAAWSMCSCDCILVIREVILGLALKEVDGK